MAREDCSCFSGIDIRRGVDAVQYAERHLEELNRRNYRIEYVCPDYGKGWIMDYPGGTPHGGPTDSMARLRTIGRACRDLRVALADLTFILPDNRAAVECAHKLVEHLGQCSDPPRL
jgi:hypothetical protein